MGEGKQLYIFGKCFTNFSKVKHFIIFYKKFYSQWKIFYKFDYILPTNKHLKNGKTFLKNILLQKKWNLSFKNLNPTQNKNPLSKFQNVYIFTNGFFVESLLYPMFFFSSCNLCTCICIGRIDMLYRFIGIDKFIWYSLSLSLEQFFS